LQLPHLFIKLLFHGTTIAIYIIDSLSFALPTHKYVRFIWVTA
jgi:hypothetical protein